MDFVTLSVYLYHIFFGDFTPRERLLTTVMSLIFQDFSNVNDVRDGDVWIAIP
jgi:hypothetical protein